MIHVTGAEYLGWALLCLGGASCVLSVVIADHAEITRRLRQAGHLLAEAGPWLNAAIQAWAFRGHSPSRAHPAARAVQGCTCQGHLQGLPDDDDLAAWYAMEQAHPAPGRES